MGNIEEFMNLNIEKFMNPNIEECMNRFISRKAHISITNARTQERDREEGGR